LKLRVVFGLLRDFKNLNLKKIENISFEELKILIFYDGFKTTLETSGEDVKTTLETSGEDEQKINKSKRNRYRVPLNILKTISNFPENTLSVVKCDEIFTLETGGEDWKNTLETSVFCPIMFTIFRGKFYAEIFIDGDLRSGLKCVLNLLHSKRVEKM
jgi:hypothetical protein